MIVQAGSEVAIVSPPDLFDPALGYDPYPIYEALRSGPDVAYDPAKRWWIVHRYADVRAVLRDRESFSTIYTSIEQTLHGADGEAHDRVRRALAPNFLPAGVESLRALVAQHVAEALDGFSARGGGDVIADLANPVAEGVVRFMLGLPASAPLKAWAQSAKSNSTGALETSRNALRHHFAGVAANGAARPSELTLDEWTDVGLLMVAAGLDTITSVIGSAIEMLSRHEQLAGELRRRPEGVAPFIEEVLRYRSPIQRTARSTVRKTRVADQTIPKRATVLVMIGVANRDPRKFSEPDRFQPQRMPNDHIAFGSGAHTCIGLWLARMEAIVVIQALLGRFSRIEPANGIPVAIGRGDLWMFGPERFEIAVGP